MAVKRFQRIGVRQPEILVEKQSSVSPRSKAQTIFQTNGSSQAFGSSAVPSKVEGKSRSQPETNHGFGGRVIFAQRSPIDVIATVMRQPAQLIRSWGGVAIVPLYWLDTEPDYEDLVGKNKWLFVAQTGSKWRARQSNKPRFTLSVNGGLEWPTIIPYG